MQSALSASFVIARLSMKKFHERTFCGLVTMTFEFLYVVVFQFNVRQSFLSSFYAALADSSCLFLDIEHVNTYQMHTVCISMQLFRFRK